MERILEKKTQSSDRHLYISKFTHQNKIPVVCSYIYCCRSSFVYIDEPLTKFRATKAFVK